MMEQMPQRGNRCHGGTKWKGGGSSIEIPDQPAITPEAKVASAQAAMRTRDEADSGLRRNDI